jgi:hypothetical protein
MCAGRLVIGIAQEHEAMQQLGRAMGPLLVGRGMITSDPDESAGVGTVVIRLRYQWRAKLDFRATSIDRNLNFSVS